MFECAAFDPGAATDPLVGRVAAINAAVEGFVDQEVWQSGDDALLWSVAALEHARRLLEAQQLQILAEATDRGASLTATGESTSSWLQGVLGMTRPAASGQIDFARALHEKFPLVRDAVATGAISTAAAKTVIRALTGLPSSVTTAVIAEAEEVLVAQAAVLTNPELVKAGRYLRDVLDPDGADRQLRGEDKATDGRELILTTDDSGVLKLRGWLDPEAGVALRTALDAFAAPRPAEDGTTDERSPARRNADALAQLALGVLDGGGLPTSGGNRPHISITLPYAGLAAGAVSSGVWRPGMVLTGNTCSNPVTGIDQTTGDYLRDALYLRSFARPDAASATATSARPPQELSESLLDMPGQAPFAITDWGVNLSPATARRLACDAKVIPVVLGAHSEPLDVGRAAYVVPTGMRRALVTRDHGCAFPSCGRPAGWCHAHHIQHWVSGGETKIDNLVLLCGEHHRAVHHHGWDVTIGTDRLPTFTPPPWIDPDRKPIRNDWRHHLHELANPG